MTIFKDRKLMPTSSETQKAYETKKEMILPEVMMMTYSKFIAQEHDSKVNPIKQELKKLEQRQIDMQQLYEKAVKDADTDAMRKISAIRVQVGKQLKEKQRELQEAEQQYKIDMTAQFIASELDQLPERKHLYALYMQIGQHINNLLPLLVEAETTAHMCGITSSMSSLLTAIQTQFSYNFKHDLSYHIKNPNKKALVNALNERLLILKVERDKRDALQNTLTLNN